MQDSPRRGLLRLAGALLLALGLATAGSQRAEAQGSTVYQNGTAIANHLAKFVTNGRIADVGDILGDANGLGVAPFAIYDNGRLGLCSDNASTLGTYSSICLGHDSAGNAVIQYTGTGSLAWISNGVSIPLPGSITGMPAVIDNATLETTASSFGTAVLRLDYAIGRGAPPLVYRPSTSACSLNSGAGDGGSQVPSSDGKCWIASFPAGGISPLDFGAKCDGTTDDTTAVQNTVNAAAAVKGPGVVTVANHLCSITALTLSGVTIEGSVDGSPDGHPSGFQAGATNANLITIPAGHPPVILRNFSIEAAFGGVKNTAGIIISNKSSNNIIEGLYIHDACTAIAEDGNSNTYRDLKIYSTTYDQTGCNLVQVGNSTTNSATTDPRFLHMTINGGGSGATHNAFSGFFIYDCGGCFFSDNDVLLTSIGTGISPAANQQVAWGFWSNTVLGDSTSGNGLDINTETASAVVKGLQFTGAWVGSVGNYNALNTYTAATGVNIANGGGGIVDGIHFSGLRVYLASKSGIVVQAGKGITIDASTICGAGASGSGQGSGISLSSGVSSVAVRNSTIHSICDGAGGNNMLSPILLIGTNNNITITGNDLLGNGDGVGLGASITNGNNIVIANNLGIDEQMLTVAAAATLDPHAFSKVYLTGAGTVQNILSGWAGREMLVTTAGVVTFATTGTVGQSMCGGLTSSAGGVYRFVYLPGVNCWGHS